MSRIPLGYFVAAGLLFWGLPAIFVAGPWAIVYTVAAVSLVVWICHKPLQQEMGPERRLSNVAGATLAIFSLVYVVLDATFGRQLLQFNMFLHHGAAVEQEIDTFNAEVSKGGGVATLLGYIFTLLPIALVDAARNSSRYGRWLLWVIALAVMFYESGSGRGFVLMAVAALVLGRSSDWRRMTIGLGFGIILFMIASSFRGDTANTQINPLVDGVVAPFVNLALMLRAGCGTAPWYSFILEFLKKFLPGFLIPKTIFSFNMEMSLCIYPNIDNTVVAGISIFTWLGEIFYYTPSLLTALIAGCILGVLSRVVDGRMVRSGLYSVRLLAGLLCFYMPRSRTQDMFTFLIAQWIFLAIFWPQLRNLPHTLRRFLPPVSVHVVGPASAEEHV